MLARLEEPFRDLSVDVLNDHLGKLEGNGGVVHSDAEGDLLVLRFGGSVGGPYDDGEILLRFEGVEVVHLPQSVMLPVCLREGGAQDLDRLLPDPNYREERANLWLLLDDVKCEWHVYARRMTAKLLPIFWKRP